MLLIDTYRDPALEAALPLLRFLKARTTERLPAEMCVALRLCRDRGWVEWRKRWVVSEAGVAAMGEGDEGGQG